MSSATPPSDQLSLLLATVQEMSKKITSLEKPSRKRKMEESIEVETVLTPTPSEGDASMEEESGDEDKEVLEAGDVEEEPADEPRLSRAPPPLPPQMMEELTYGRVGSFVNQDVRTRLYTKTWKAPPAILVEAKDQQAPKDQHWSIPGKETDALKLVQAFNKAERVISHSRLSLSFGSASVAAQLKGSNLLSKQEKDFLSTGLDAQQARDNELLWRAVRLHQEAQLTEDRMRDMTDLVTAIQRDHPEWWAQLREERAAAHPDAEEDVEPSASLAEQQAARLKDMTGNTVALFMETLKQGYRKAYLYSAKALGVTPENLGSSRPTLEVLVCPPTLMAEAQARAALPQLGASSKQFFRGSAPTGQRSRQRGAARGGSRKTRRQPTQTKRTGKEQPNATRPQPPAHPGAAQSGRPRQDRKPAAPKNQKGTQFKKQKKE